MTCEDVLREKAEKARWELVASSRGSSPAAEYRAVTGPDVMLLALDVIEAARALHALPPYAEAQGHLDALEDALAAWDYGKAGGMSKISQRQLELHAWMADPSDEALPRHPAIDRRHAYWSASELVTHSGLYSPDKRQACLRDLHNLRVNSLVVGAGTRWRICYFGELG